MKFENCVASLPLIIESYFLCPIICIRACSFWWNNIDRTQLMLKNCEECDNVKEIHRYDLCIIPLTEAEIVLKDDIVSGVDKILPDEKLSLFYIAGYIASKHKEVCGNDDGSFDDVKSPLSTLDRGKLSYPTTHFFLPCTLGICIFFWNPWKTLP